MIETLLRSARQATRGLVRDGGFTVTAILVLALGIGTSTGILTMARAVLAHALPYPNGDRLVQLFEAHPPSGMNEVFTSYRNFVDWQEQAQSFEALAVSYNPLNVVLGVREETATVRASLVTPDYFEITGAKPLLGRLFDGGDHRRPGGHAVAIVSEELWAQRFESDPGLVGRPLRINDLPYTVVGIVPAGFADYPNVTQRTDLWLPMMMAAELVHPRILEQRNYRGLPVIARLRPGTSIDEARAEMITISERLGQAYPDTNADWVASIKTVRETYLGAYREPLIALLVGSLFLLMVGCANVANLQLVRAHERHCELALRMALGASRRRLLADTLLESLILTAAAAVLGVLSAVLLTPLAARSMPLRLPSFVDLQADGVALAAAVATAALVAILFGFVPLVGLDRGDLRSTLAGTGKGQDNAAGGQWLRRALVIVEVAAAAVLLLGAGLFVRSTTELLRTDLGFDPTHLLTVNVRVPLESRSSTEMVALAADLEQAAAAIPGAREAILWAPHMPGVAFWYTQVRPADRPELRDEELLAVRYHYVGGGALGKLGLKFVAGRDFEAIDSADGEPVVVLSRSLAAALWPGDEPLGKILRRWNREQWRRVVGVVEDAYLAGRQGNGADFTQDVYFPYAQGPQNDIALLVRTDGNATGSTLREVVQQRASDLPVYDMQTMSERLGAEEAAPKITTALATSTAGLALLLAAVGLYAVVAYTVSRERHEIAIRVALGAWPGAVLRRVVAQGLGLALVGTALGVVVAYATTRFLESLLYGISPTDPITFVSVPIIVLAVVTLACLVPGLRATRIHPMSVLRDA